MDTSKEYIEMCEKAKEIQCFRISGRYEFGDMMVLFCLNIDRLYYLEGGYSHDGKFRFIGSYDGYDKDKELIEKSIWLPRQDQLQEIMKIDYQLVWHKNGKVEFWFTPENSRMEVVDSVEQGLILAIMELKFNKEWDGKEWIKKND